MIGLSQLLRRAVATTLAALREIFDESAYARFLAKERLSPSSAAYARFQQEQASLRTRRFRCC